MIDNLELDKMIYNIAFKYSKYYDIDDLYQAGILGAVKASKKFNESLGTKFSTYSYPFILGEIISFIKNDRVIKVSDDYFSLYKMYEKTKLALTNSLSKEPTFKEIASFMKIEEQTLVNIIESVLFAKNIENDEYELNSTFYIDERDKINNQLSIKEELAKLNEFERKLIDYRYYQGFNQCETAQMLGTNQVKISREEKLILSKMRKNLI